MNYFLYWLIRLGFSIFSGSSFDLNFSKINHSQFSKNVSAVGTTTTTTTTLRAMVEWLQRLSPVLSRHQTRILSSLWRFLTVGVASQNFRIVESRSQNAFLMNSLNEICPYSNRFKIGWRQTTAREWPS